MLQEQMVAAWDGKFTTDIAIPSILLRMLTGGCINHKQKTLIWMWPACNTGNNLTACVLASDGDAPQPLTLMSPFKAPVNAGAFLFLCGIGDFGTPRPTKD